MVRQDTQIFSYFYTKILFSVIFSIFLCSHVFAQGNLMISPKRLVFDGSKKTLELNLANTGKDTATYIISVKEIRMLESGAFEEILQPDSGQYFASKYLRFYPRTVVLGPNEAQSVKVQQTKTADLPPGEYRSHIYFRAVPKQQALGEKETRTDSSNISVKLTPVFGITIPAIIRVGESTTNVTISDVALKSFGDTTYRIEMLFHRTGNMSSYGDIVVNYTSPDGKTTEVGMAKGLAVYTPNASRRFQFDLANTTNINFHKGKIQVMYVMQPDDKGLKNSKTTTTTIAQLEMTLK